MQYSSSIPSDPSLDSELHPMSDPTNPNLFFAVEVHDTLGRPLFLLKCGRVQSITCRALVGIHLIFVPKPSESSFSCNWLMTDMIGSYNIKNITSFCGHFAKQTALIITLKRKCRYFESSVRVYGAILLTETCADFALSKLCHFTANNPVSDGTCE